MRPFTKSLASASTFGRTAKERFVFSRRVLPWEHKKLTQESTDDLREAVDPPSTRRRQPGTCLILQGGTPKLCNRPSPPPPPPLNPTVHNHTAPPFGSASSIRVQTTCPSARRLAMGIILHRILLRQPPRKERRTKFSCGTQEKSQARPSQPSSQHTTALERERARAVDDGWSGVEVSIFLIFHGNNQPAFFKQLRNKVHFYYFHVLF